MIVQNIGYLKLDDVLALEDDFSIYETRKNTHILVKKAHDEQIHLYYIKKDRMPWKDVEGKKITSGVRVFDSKTQDKLSIDVSKWNNKNQIMSYKPFDYKTY